MSDVIAKHIERLPRRVKVGGHSYEIERTKAEGDPDLEGDYGCTNLETMRIALSDALLFQKLVNILYHELNHAVNHAYGIDDNSCEEDMACQSATGWIQLRIDNPKLDRWLNRSMVLLRKMK